MGSKRRLQIACAAACIAAVAVASLVVGRSSEASSTKYNYYTGMIFSQTGFGLYVTNTSKSTQTAKVIVRDETGLKIALADTTPISIDPKKSAYRPFYCPGSSCIIGVQVITNSEQVFPALNNDPPGTDLYESFPAGAWVMRKTS